MPTIPYLFQRRVADLLLAGRNVILQAPTGAGKTLAAKLPFLEARNRNLDFPRRCIYAVPMRVLANQFASEPEVGLDVRIQTGEHRDDPRFEADITYATIDQVLSSYLLMPYSLSGRMGNLNAGAIASSYLVFDEFHLFDPVNMLPTTLEMLRTLRGVAPFLLMTATFSREMLDGLAQTLNAVVVPESEGDREAMQSLRSQQKTRRYHVQDEPLSADAVLAHHDRRTLVICNVVARAQKLYRELANHPERGNTQVLLLHSRFLPEDRARIEEQVRELYQQGATGDGRWIVVSTQAIEVGLDITCENLHTELAPANAILQRAGRCARYQGETGDVHIYGCTLNETGEPIDLVTRCLPYRGMEEEMAATLQAFAEASGQALGFAQEQDLVSRVHGPRDRRIVQGLQGGLDRHRRTMNAAMRGDRSAAAELIRDVVSLPVMIHDRPHEVLETPFAYESFSMHPGTLAGMVKDWLERTAEDDELDDQGVMMLAPGPEEEEGVTSYEWLPVYDSSGIFGAPLLLVHPSLATYDPTMGFLPEQGGTYRASLLRRDEKQEWERYSYSLETYEEHAERVWRAACAIWPDLARAAARLEARAGWPAGSLQRMAELAALTHDVGKLNRSWQEWVRRYQENIGKPVTRDFYAHTDSDPNDPSHLDASRRAGRRPPHAVESALAVAPLIATLADEHEALRDATFSAIARHHSAQADSFQSFHLVDEACDIMLNMLHPLGLEEIDPTEALIDQAKQEEWADSVEQLWVNEDDDDAIVAYMLLSRLLRQADQIGTAAARNEES
jgi:CRISPR-associated endonuclease/helicase Cas3